MEATSPSQRYLRNQETETRLTQNYLTSLHSTRKQPAKPWKKPPAAAAMNPRIYRVEPVNFKELVQKLTGAPESLLARRTEHKTQPSLRASIGPKPLDTAAAKPFKTLDEAAKESFFGFDLQPSSTRFWDAFPLLSPANLSRW